MSDCVVVVAVTTCCKRKRRGGKLCPVNIIEREVRKNTCMCPNGFAYFSYRLFACVVFPATAMVDYVSYCTVQ